MLSVGPASVKRSIWGSADDDIWAAGFEGTLLHYDGTSWASVESKTTEVLYALSGSAGFTDGTGILKKVRP